MSRSNNLVRREVHRLGIDVGGTNTDAVVLDSSNRVVAKAKRATTPDVTTGIVNALRAVLDESSVPKQSIAYAMLGTTHCTNAIVTRTGLSPVGVIRLGAPATFAVPPLLTWPEDLRRVVSAQTFILHGGHEYNGEVLAPLDPKELSDAARRVKGHVRAIAVTGVFSPVNAEHELRARDLLQAELGKDFPITLSCEIASVGLLERENAAVLNAALGEVARNAVMGFQNAMANLGLKATLFLGQNDGTLMSVEFASRYPVLTVASGPSNSIRGAAYLSGLRDAIVVDIGGTTTDIGILQKGFPRESGVAVEIGGVRTNFRMPDLVSIGLGGGSLVHHNGELCVGPDSVGYRLTEEAMVFGGAQLTATDLAVAAGRIKLGESARVSGIELELVGQSFRYIDKRVEESIERIKLTAESVPVVVVGGGSMLFPDRVNGVSEVIRPPHHDVANAIGVAIAQVSGMVDRVYSYDTIPRQSAIEQATAMAKDRAIAAGAGADSVEVLEVEEVPLAYMPGNAARIKVKAAGALQLSTTAQPA